MRTTLWYRRLPWMAGVQTTATDGGSAGNTGAAFPPTATDGASAEPGAVSEGSLIHWTTAGTGFPQTWKRFFRETRRLWRLGRLLAHVLVGAVIVYGIFAMLTLAAADRGLGRRHALVRWWNRGVLRILNVHLHLEGQIAAGAVLFTANHISWLDVPCLRAVVDATFVAKDAVRRWPVIGRMSAQAGTIFLRRGGPNAANETAEQMTWSLARRRPVIVFPEGTTSEGRTVRYFYGRLYQSAVRTRGMVQAVAIAYPHASGAHPRVPFVGDDDLVRHLWRLLNEDRIEARLVFCTPLPAAGRERRALAARSRVQVLETLGLMPGTAAEK